MSMQWNDHTGIDYEPADFANEPYYAIGEGDAEPMITNGEDELFSEFHDAIEEAVWLSLKGQRWSVWQISPVKYLAATIYPKPKS